MELTSLQQFLACTVGLVMLGTVVAAVVAPPDPYTQLRWLTALVPVAVVVGYLLVYRGGYDVLDRGE